MRNRWVKCRAKCVVVLGVFLAAGAGGAFGQASSEESRPPSIPSIEDKTRDMTHLEGFFDLYWDDSAGKLYWEVGLWDKEFLYQVSLASGLGSNPVGLDRGQLGRTHLLEARRVGPTVLLVEPNYRYRARSDNPDEVRAVRDAFAPSTHWGFKVEAETGDRVLVDGTDFFLRDSHGIARRLKDAEQGDFELDRSRSVIHLPRTKAFPRNTEIEALLTFTSASPGELVWSTAASGDAVTLRVRYSLVRLPEDGYEPRRADPRVGAFGVSFKDYATPIDEDLDVLWVNRHRLEKKDPRAARSEAIEPLVYYLDRGAPEPIRSALLEGAAWWNAAFEEAGFVDAFRVELLPADADPLDLRYNMIHWTHRSTRGWSYGGSVVDPRTGEMLKGNVNLGSLRLRQDYLLGSGLSPTSGYGLGGCGIGGGPAFEYLAQVGSQNDPVEMALARVRQLSAHEVGHTLGLAHNYIASTYADRASVMDYPAPLVEITPDGRLDLSNAYGVGVGEYDKFAVKWLYSDFAPGTDEKAALEAIVKDGLDRQIRFISGRDAIPAGAAHPLAALWDNGADPVGMLRHEIQVRRIGLETFGPDVIRPGDPMASLEKVLVPLYLHHRYQLEAAMHSIGGADYNYALQGDGQRIITIVPGQTQREALDVVLSTLDPEFLAVPERVLRMLPPRAYREPDSEKLERWTGLTFDPLAAAASASGFTVKLLLNSERMARLVEYHSRSSEYPGLPEVTESLLERTWKAPSRATAYLEEVQQTMQRAVLDELLRQASNRQNISQARAILTVHLAGLADWLESVGTPTPHQKLAAEDIRRWQERPHGTDAPTVPHELPPGSPIGVH